MITNYEPVSTHQRSLLLHRLAGLTYEAVWNEISDDPEDMIHIRSKYGEKRVVYKYEMTCNYDEISHHANSYLDLYQVGNEHQAQAVLKHAWALLPRAPHHPCQRLIYHPPSDGEIESYSGHFAGCNSYTLALDTFLLLLVKRHYNLMSIHLRDYGVNGMLYASKYFKDWKIDETRGNIYALKYAWMYSPQKFMEKLPAFHGILPFYVQMSGHLVDLSLELPLAMLRYFSGFALSKEWQTIAHALVSHEEEQHKDIFLHYDSTRESVTNDEVNVPFGARKIMKSLMENGILMLQNAPGRYEINPLWLPPADNDVPVV